MEHEKLRDMNGWQLEKGNERRGYTSTQSYIVTITSARERELKTRNNHCEATGDDLHKGIPDKR
jgi:hypothetical protein